MMKGSLVGDVLKSCRTFVDPYSYCEVGFHRRGSDHVLLWMCLKSLREWIAGCEGGIRTELTATETTTSIDSMDPRGKKRGNGAK